MATCTEAASVPRIALSRVLVLLVCFMATFVLMQRGLTGVHATKIKKSLRSFPSQIGAWKLVGSRASAPEVVKMLGVDDYIDYTYVDASGRKINLYVGFYETVGGGKGYHSPKNCLPGGGWGIDRTSVVRLSPADRTGEPVGVSEMLIREGSDYQVVLYWFQNRGRIIASEYWEKIYLVLDALLKKRRDGAFVRVMAQVPDGRIQETEEVAKEFATLALAELDEYLPGRQE